MDTICDKEKINYPSELSCAKQFLLRTHNGKEVKGKLALQLDENDSGIEHLFYTSKNTFIINNDKLFVIGNKGKLQLQKGLDDLSDEIETDYDSKLNFLGADNETVWLHLGNYILHYNFAKKKPLRTIDLKNWEPHHVVLDGAHVWLISSIDGLLYGLTID